MISSREQPLFIEKKNEFLGRERDVYVRHVPEYGGTYIILLTRNGGGNREDYQDSFDSLETHPNYVDNWDCDWDCTYAEICFSIPEVHREEVMKMTQSKDPGEKFDDFINALGRMKK